MAQAPGRKRTILRAGCKLHTAAGLAGEKYFEYDYGYEPTRARTQRRLNLARLHVQDELQRLGAEANPDIQALFSGRGILEYYLGQPGD